MMRRVAVDLLLGVAAGAVMYGIFGVYQRNIPPVSLTAQSSEGCGPAIVKEAITSDPANSLNAAIQNAFEVCNVYTNTEPNCGSGCFPDKKDYCSIGVDDLDCFQETTGGVPHWVCKSKPGRPCTCNWLCTDKPKTICPKAKALAGISGGLKPGLNEAIQSAFDVCNTKMNMRPTCSEGCVPDKKDYCSVGQPDLDCTQSGDMWSCATKPGHFCTCHWFCKSENDDEGTEPCK